MGLAIGPGWGTCDLLERSAVGIVGIAVENLAFLGGERAPALGSLLTLLRVSAGTRPSLGCLRPVFRRRATVPPSVKRRDRSGPICSNRPSSRATTGRSAPTRSLH